MVAILNRGQEPVHLRIVIFLIGLLLIGFPDCLEAEREPLIPEGRIGAQYLALGGAGVALPGTVESLFINPALLVFNEWPEIATGIGNQDLGDQRQFHIAAALPLVRQLVVGAGVSRLHFPLGNHSDFETYLISLAFTLSPNGSIIAGINGKFIREELPGLLEVASGGGMDLGLLYIVFDTPEGMALRIGGTWQNAQTVLKKQQEEYNLPSIYRLGVSFQLSSDRLMSVGYDSRQSDLAFYEKFQVLRVGLEQKFHLPEDLGLAFRFGFTKRLDQNGFLTSGLGFQLADWQFDYSFQLPLSFSDAYHQLSVSWGFQRSIPSEAHRPIETAKAKASSLAEEKQRKNLFLALDSAAEIGESFEIAPSETPLATATPVTERPSAETEPVQEQYAYNLSIPAGPADQEKASLGVAPEIPSSFSSAFTAGGERHLRFSQPDLRLHVVVNPFSPNGDGRFDNTIFVGHLVTEKFRLSRWTLFILRAGDVVRSFTGGAQLPRNLEWDGKDLKGQTLADGTYQASLQIFDEFGMQLASAAQNVEIKTKAQPLSFSGPKTVVLSGGAKDKPINFTFPLERGTSHWQFRIQDTKGQNVFEKSSGSALPEEIKWSAKVRGKVAAVGNYVARLSYLDPVGLQNQSEWRFNIQYADYGVELSAAPELFKPQAKGGQGVQFQFRFIGNMRIKDWLLRIVPEKQETPERLYKGKGQPPSTLHWDGSFSKDEMAMDGKIYSAFFTANSDLGNLQAQLPQLQCDIGTYTGEKALSVNLVRVQFDPGSAELSPTAQVALNNAAETLERYTHDYQLQITGHCDLAEGKKQAVEISRARAQAVADFLIQSRNIPKEKITVIGRGDSQLLSADDTEEVQAKNRRVEVMVFAQ